MSYLNAPPERHANSKPSMVGLATLLETFVHPGHFFPALATYGKAKSVPRGLNGSESSVEKAVG